MMKISILIFLLLLTGCGRHEVEINIVGAWQLFEVNDKGTITSVPTEPSGYFIFSDDGKISMANEDLSKKQLKIPKKIIEEELK